MVEVRHNSVKRRYELHVDGDIVLADYVQRGDVLMITHTGTPAALRGRGLASQLVHGMLIDVRQNGQKIVPLCSFVADYIDRHPDQQDLVHLDEA